MSAQEEEDYEKEKNEFIRLSVKGTQEYRSHQLTALRQVSYWLFVGTVGGYVTSKILKELPMKMTPTKLKRWQNIAIFGGAIVFTYHGYKLAQRDLKKATRKLLKDPSNLMHVQPPQSQSTSDSELETHS